MHNKSFFRHFGFSDVDAPVAGAAFQVYPMARLQPADDKHLPAAGRAAAGAADAEAAGRSRGTASSAAAGEAEERGEGKPPIGVGGIGSTPGSSSGAGSGGGNERRRWRAAGCGALCPHPPQFNWRVCAGVAETICAHILAGRRRITQECCNGR